MHPGRWVGDAEAAVANKEDINTSVRGQSRDIGHLGSEPAGNGRTDPPALGVSRDHRTRVGDDGLPGGDWGILYLFDFIDILA